jgi:membrane protease YdiL (CAAX protease family)
LTYRRAAHLLPLFLFSAWTCAWLAGSYLRDTTGWFTNAEPVYWIVTKLALWMVPVHWLMRQTHTVNTADFLGLRKPGRGIGAGIVIGTGLLLFSLLADLFFGGASFVIPVLDLAVLNGVFVAPTVEEIALRGFYLRSLMDSGVSFGRANWFAALVFVGMHLPGWYFQARLRAPLSAIQPALFLLLLALFLGWLKDRTGSLWACIAVHGMNNAYTAFRG